MKNKIILIGIACAILLIICFSVLNRARIVNEDRFFLTYTSPYTDLVKYIKTKNRGYIKWTSTIEKINSKSQLTLKAPNLPKVIAFFDYSAVKNSFKVGDIITVSGIPYLGKIENNESSYYLKSCRIESSTDEDLKLYAQITSPITESEEAQTFNNVSPTPIVEKAPSDSDKDVQEISPSPTGAESETSGELEYISEDFKDFDQSFDSLTDLQRDNITKDLRFKNILWTGYVIDVNKTNITFSTEENSKDKAFIVYMSSSEKQNMLNINKNDKVTISGYILKSKGLTPWVIAGGKIEHP